LGPGGLLAQERIRGLSEKSGQEGPNSLKGCPYTSSHAARSKEEKNPETSRRKGREFRFARALRLGSPLVAKRSAIVKVQKKKGPPSGKPPGKVRKKELKKSR